MSALLNLGYTHFSYTFSIKEVFSFHYRKPLSLVHYPDKLFLALMSCTSYKSCVVAPCTAHSSRRPAMSWAKLGKLPMQEICEAADGELLTFRSVDFIYQNPLPQPCCPHLNKFALYKTETFFRGCFKCTVPAAAVTLRKILDLVLFSATLQVL